MTRDSKFLTSVRHPEYLEDEMYWWDFRDCYNGGPRFLRRNLKEFSTRESKLDYTKRMDITPIPSYAKAAVNDIRNSIFQRIRDVSRRNGSDNYMRAAAGEIGGMDNKGSSMQSFLGIDVLTELLVMGRAGVYVDMPELAGLRTMADEGNARPYTYMYRVEDILSWATARPEEPGNFTAILLRDRGIDYNQGFAHGAYLPTGGYTRYRFIWIDPNDQQVRMKLYDEEDNQINLRGDIIKDAKDVRKGTAVQDDVGVIHLELDRIPFHMLTIGGSVLKDVYKHQVALLNLGSSDISYALKANFPFFIEQKDLRAVGAHLKQMVEDDGTTTTSNNTEPGEEARPGVTHGRAFDLNAKIAPAFIHPSSEPLKASMLLQEKLEDDIRKLVNLAVQNKMGQRAISAEAMKLSDQGLEAGLSYIGLVLESAERAIASHWAAYESKDPEKRKIATVKYPDRYSLKNDEDRIKEAKELAELMYTVPGKEVKKELSKNIVTVLLSGKVNTATIDKIFSQIDNAGYTTSDPEIIIKSVEAGLCGEQTGSLAIGFDVGEHIKAREDHVRRAEDIAMAQAKAAPQSEKSEDDDDMAARGVEDLDADKNSGKKEREGEQKKEMNAERKDGTRGEGKNIKSKDKSRDK